MEIWFVSKCKAKKKTQTVLKMEIQKKRSERESEKSTKNDKIVFHVFCIGVYLFHTM